MRILNHKCVCVCVCTCVRARVRVRACMLPASRAPCEIIVFSDLWMEWTILNRAMIISIKITGPERKRGETLNYKRNKDRERNEWRDGEREREREWPVTLVEMKWVGEKWDRKLWKKPLSGFKNIMMKEMEVMREGNRWIVWWVCSETKRDWDDQGRERNTLHSNSPLSCCVVLKRGGGQVAITQTLLWVFSYSLISLSRCLVQHLLSTHQTRTSPLEWVLIPGSHH